MKGDYAVNKSDCAIHKKWLCSPFIVDLVREEWLYSPRRGALQSVKSDCSPWSLTLQSLKSDLQSIKMTLLSVKSDSTVHEQGICSPWRMIVAHEMWLCGPWRVTCSPWIVTLLSLQSDSAVHVEWLYIPWRVTTVHEVWLDCPWRVTAVHEQLLCYTRRVTVQYMKSDSSLFFDHPPPNYLSVDSTAVGTSVSQLLVSLKCWQGQIDTEDGDCALGKLVGAKEDIILEFIAIWSTLSCVVHLSYYKRLISPNFCRPIPAPLFFIRFVVLFYLLC
jgi:hypothetical protein